MITRREYRANREPATDQKDTMNKNVAFIVIGSLVAIGLIGSVVLHLLRPDTVAAFMPNLITLLGLIVTAAGTIYSLGKLDQKMDSVHKNTNGTLTALRAAIDEKDNIIREQNDRMVRLAEKVPPSA